MILESKAKIIKEKGDVLLTTSQKWSSCFIKASNETHTQAEVWSVVPLKKGEVLRKVSIALLV